MLNLFFLLLIAQPDTTETVPMESIAYSADSLVFSIPDENLVLIGNASLEKEQMSVSADTISYSSGAKTVTAAGNTSLTDGNDTVEAAALVYHIPTGTARTFFASSSYDRARYSSETITMLSRHEFNLTDVTFTSCEKDTFDYYFWSRIMKVFPDDKAVAKPLVLYVQDTPVFWLPYAVFPIRRGRTSGFTIPTIGSSSRDGRYIRKIGYYFGFSDYLDLLISTDLMEKTRFQATLTERHKLRYVYSGRNRIQWRRQFIDGRDRWLIESAHTHELPGSTMLKMTANFVSDRSYLQESQSDPQERMKSQLRSWLSLSRSFGRGSAQANFEYIEYLDALPDTIDNEKLSELNAPDIRFTLPSSPVFPSAGVSGDGKFLSSLYWNFSSHYLSENTEWEDSSLYNSGLKLVSSITSSSRPGGILAVSPSVKTTAVLYNTDMQGNPFPGWAQSSFGLSLGTDIYGIFSTSLAGYSLFRHSISPTITVNWAPKTYLASDGSLRDTEDADSVFYRFADFAAPSGGTTVSFSILNLLEGKRYARGRIQRNTLAELSLGTTWNPDREDERFSPIGVSLNLTPFHALSSRVSSSYNAYTGEATSLSVVSTLQLAGVDPTMQPDSVHSIIPLQWNLSVSHNWTPSLQSDQYEINKLRLSASLDITTRWSLQYKAYYDIATNDFISQDYTIMRDLDSWEAIFTRHVSDIDTGFYFRINIKAFPDIKVEQHTSSF